MNRKASFGVVVLLVLLLAPAVAFADTCFSKGESKPSGLNKVCFYTCASGDAAITVGAVQLCPLTINNPKTEPPRTKPYEFTSPGAAAADSIVEWQRQQQLRKQQLEEKNRQMDEQWRQLQQNQTMEGMRREIEYLRREVEMLREQALRNGLTPVLYATRRRRRPFL